MNDVIDFTNCKRIHTSFGGSDRKFGVEYNGERYMLKFSENHAKKHDISTSYVNNVISEYISSHISQSIGLPTHETVLGIYDETIVVAYKDFRRAPDVLNLEFGELVHAKYDSKDIKRFIELNQIYETLKDKNNDVPLKLQEASIKRYWETFVIDALVGNFDRHIGNWGYLVKDNMLSLAPIYDYGSTLFPQLSDKGIEEMLDNEYEMFKRSMVFPSPALVITDKKVGKVGYYDMLSSNYDSNCTRAIIDIAPNINLDKINKIIDETPMITDIRKRFYKTILQLRKEIIIDRAFIRCVYKEYDEASYIRLNMGKQFSEDDLREFIKNRSRFQAAFNNNEKQLLKCNSPEYAIATILKKTESPINTQCILKNQRNLVENYGFYSESVLQSAINKARTKSYQMSK